MSNPPNTTPAIAGSGAVIVDSSQPPNPSNVAPDTGKGPMANASSGMQLFVYVIAGMGAVIAIFIICMLGNTMGTYVNTTIKRLFLRDRSGNVSLLTEIVMFIVAISIIGAAIGTAFSTADRSATTTSMLDPNVPVVRAQLVAPFAVATNVQQVAQPTMLAAPKSV